MYWIRDDYKDGSEEEMNEIVLIEYLDIIHTLFIHSGLMSDAKKFITEIGADRNNSNLLSQMSMSNLMNSPLPPLNNANGHNGNGVLKESDDSKESGEEGNAGPEPDIMSDPNYDSVSEISTIATEYGNGNKAAFNHRQYVILRVIYNLILSL